MSYKFSTLARIGLQTCLLVSITNAYAEDLRTIYHLAQENDPVIAEAKATQLANVEVLPQARANLLPILAGTWTASYNDSSNPILDRYNADSYGFSVNQPLVNIAFWQQYSQVGDQVKSALATYSAAEQNLIIRVATQYFAILKAKDDLDFARAERKAFSRLLEQTQQRFKVGLIAITDVHEAQAKHDNAYAQEITSENELADQLEIMSEITGKPMQNYRSLKKDMKLTPPEPENIDHWVQSALEHNFSLLAKQADTVAAQKNILIQRAGHFPTLNLDGSITKSKSAPPTQTTSILRSVSISASVPILSGGSVNSKTREAIQTHAKALHQLEELRRETKSETRQAYRGVITRISQIAALKQAVVSSRSALEATEAAFQVGTRTIVDVLDAQSDILNAERNFSKARYDYLLEMLRLKQYAGTLNRYDLYAINELFA